MTVKNFDELEAGDIIYSVWVGFQGVIETDTLSVNELVYIKHGVMIKARITESTSELASEVGRNIIYTVFHSNLYAPFVRVFGGGHSFLTTDKMFLDKLKFRLTALNMAYRNLPERLNRSFDIYDI